MTEARVYLRISRPDEADILDNQRRSALDYAQRTGFVLACAPYEEVASGGSTQDRPALSALMNEARPGEVIVFTSLSRMTRGGVAAALDILRQLEARGIGWHFTEQPILNFDARTPKLVRDVILAVLAAVDEDYRRRISEATRAAYARRKALAESRGERLNWGRPKKGLPDDHGGNGVP